MAKRAVVAMGGGPTRVINKTLYGLVEEAAKNGIEVLGARFGIEGILKSDFVELAPGKPPVSVQVSWPGAMIGSTRKKPKQSDCSAAFEVFRKKGVHFLFYIGGNDTAEACSIINNEAKAAKYELRVFHVPKTIDNDLVLNDHTPGFGSAARYVANAMMGDDMDTQSLPGLKINIVMGRSAGWLTAASALARGAKGDGPHLIYLCERRKSVADMAQDAVKLYKAQKRGVIAVSEGLCGPDGAEFITSPAVWKELSQPPYESVLMYLLASGVMQEAAGAKKDDFGHIQLSGTGVLADTLAGIVKLALIHKGGVEGPRVRADTLGYAQRSFAGDVSPVDEAEAEMVGREAVRHAVKGDIDGSVAVKAARDPSYRVWTELEKLGDIAGDVRGVPDEFISAEGNDVTPAFMEYGLPLVGPMARTWTGR